MIVLVAALILGLAVVVSTIVLVRELRVASGTVERNTHELRDLRLTSRTRIAQASVQSGEVTLEQQLSRLGRASAARRIVVGGDDDSEQKQRMVRAAGVGRSDRHDGDS